TTIGVDLVLTKSDGDITATPGAVIAYTLAYANTGNQDATGVVITETVPANTSFNAAASTAGWICADGAPAGTTCAFTAGTVAAGASGSATFAVQVSAAVPAGATQVANTASISDDGSNGADLDASDNTASDSTPLDAAPDLVLTKDDGGATVAPGAVIVYTLNYRNVGNQTATGVILSETVPDNTSFSAAGSTPGWNCPDGALAGVECSLNVPDLPPGASASVTFAVRVADTVSAGVDTIFNEARVRDDGSNGDDLTEDNFDDEDTPLIAAPDLEVTKDDGESFVLPGQTLTYVLTVRNVGNRGATGVEVSDILPAGLSFVEASDSGVASGGVVTWPPVDLAAGAEVSRSVTVTVADPFVASDGEITNIAEVRDDGANGTDANERNNRASDTDDVRPDLEITKSDGGASAEPGGLIRFSLHYTNTGGIGVSGVTLRETVPLHTAFDASLAENAGWSCAPAASAGSACVYTVGDLPAGASGTVSFVVRVNDPLPAGVNEVINAARISDDGQKGPDRTPDNNTASETTPLDAAPDLQLTKSDGGDPPLPGRPIAYTLSYRNVGNQGASGVVISETVPANTRFTATASSAGWSCADGAAAGTSCSFNLGSLAAGASGNVSFTVVVDNPLAPGVISIRNTASIADDGVNGPDPTPENNIGAASSNFNPTAISLLRFSATREGTQVTVRWTTGAEIDTYGFHLYRGTSSNRASALWITEDNMIASNGSDSSGDSYSYPDTSVEPGRSYWYWLVAVDRDGHEEEFGPVRTSGGVADTIRVYLPLVTR
ncbi:MAG: DUF11 domain-containing protein, partial [Chloroflexi bacterium]|nr:DUF11 domain-containing protein [Chloroflexota bacterium]